MTSEESRLIFMQSLLVKVFFFFFVFSLLLFVVQRFRRKYIKVSSLSLRVRLASARQKKQLFALIDQPIADATGPSRSDVIEVIISARSLSLANSISTGRENVD